MALPVITNADLASHTTAKSCYVVLKSKVYDVTGFIHDHPGGADLILDHAGQDVAALMEDELSHFHTETAYEILDEFLIGRLEAAQNGHAVSPDQNGPSPNADASKKPVYDATGLSCAEDLSRETDFDSDYKTYHFLNLNKPLLMQVWNGGFSKAFYLQQVHRPRHYPGGDSAPLFGNFLEPLSKTPWWMVPLIWLPPISYGTYRATNGLSVPVVGMYWILGLCIWTFVEYGLHRFLFHLDELVLAPLPKRLLTSSATSLTTGPESRCISCFTAFTTTFQWTSTDSSCHQPCLPYLRFRSGTWRTHSSSTTGTQPLRFSAAASSAMSATT
jgi:4-hydroxysphinganine ceramide fatty acyl 2-hydroxylase